MSTKIENSAKQLANGAINKKSWGTIAYNALLEGVIEGGVVDTTSALQILVNKAVSEGRRTILLPNVTNGQYRVTALTNADQVDFMGDNSTFVGGYSGTITNLGGLASHEADTATEDVHGLLTGGKIIQESGSNTNGRYIKFSDGTLICSHSFTLSAAISTASGSVFISDDIDWTFPAAFVGTLSSNISVFRSGNISWGIGIDLNNANKLTFKIAATQSTAAGTCRVNVSSIGRWKT